MNKEFGSSPGQLRDAISFILRVKLFKKLKGQFFPYKYNSSLSHDKTAKIIIKLDIHHFVSYHAFPKDESFKVTTTKHASSSINKHL